MLDDRDYSADGFHATDADFTDNYIDAEPSYQDEGFYDGIPRI
ncbi:hypothetical protein [Heliophilum fasciatum]|uniref:Uncharacterized protein n=1 Tax=Heliophilum fasciatum TaxID=35700 RepID=A0A4R2R6I7_9FIRM|nr:hypothetical protein [Heliophilum fasciatum]MCW2279510.1 hypothetical protein [Heliophilum fasciatum]TCP58662.1 hypothetical protein EDD73_1571 [Heliophilum fasciatum]